MHARQQREVSQIKSSMIQLSIRRGQTNFRVVFIFIICDKKYYYCVVWVEQLGFNCPSYCGRRHRMQGVGYAHKPPSASRLWLSIIFPLDIPVLYEKFTIRCWKLINTSYLFQILLTPLASHQLDVTSLGQGWSPALKEKTRVWMEATTKWEQMQ